VAGSCLIEEGGFVFLARPAVAVVLETVAGGDPILAIYLFRFIVLFIAFPPRTPRPAPIFFSVVQLFYGEDARFFRCAKNALTSYF